MPQQVAKLPNPPKADDRAIRTRILSRFGQAALNLYDEMRNLLGFPIENAAYGAIWPNEPIPSDLSTIPADRSAILYEVTGVSVQDGGQIVNGQVVNGQFIPASPASATGIFDFLDEKAVVYVIAALLIFFAFTQLR